MLQVPNFEQHWYQQQSSYSRLQSQISTLPFDPMPCFQELCRLPCPQFVLFNMELPLSTIFKIFATTTLMMHKRSGGRLKQFPVSSGPMIDQGSWLTMLRNTNTILKNRFRIKNQQHRKRLSKQQNRHEMAKHDWIRYKLIQIQYIQRFLIIYNKSYKFKMKNSKYSNFAGSKYSVAFTEDACEEHDGLPYTNFCSSITCVRPLCPECVENHTNHHRNMRTQPQMHSFKTLKNQCVNKIANILEKVQITQNEGSMNQINAIFQNTLFRIRQIKQNSKRIVDSYFVSLEESVKKKMVGLMSQQSDLFQQLDKANNIVNQLRLLVHRLDNSRDFITSAQTIVRLDGDKIEQKVKQSYNTVRNLKQHYKVNFHLQKGYQQKLVTFLSKLAFYGEYATNDVVPRVTEEILTKNSMKVLGRSSSQQRQTQQKRQFNNYSENQIKLRDKSRERDSRDRQRERQRQKQRDRDEDRKSTLSRKSSSKSISRGLKKNIIGMNTFKQSSPHKYLHFFQNDENILQYLDLDSEQPVFSPIELDITFKVPQFHKSIAVPSGDLYLIGGSLSNNIKSQKIYKYDFTKNTLVYCNSLKYGRSSHSVCFNNKYIYILGGILNNQVITNRCERYDILNNKVQEIKPMNYEACSFACCSFNGRYIYKIGGVADDNSISNIIEVYDEKEGEWSIVNPSVEGGSYDRIIPLSSSAATQITQHEIMVMGGYNATSVGQKQTFILRVDSTGSYIKDINSYPLPYAQGFWNNIPIIQNKIVFTLQNVSQGQDECIQNYRKILFFDGQVWKCLND